jgi:hypothetical protein
VSGKKHYSRNRGDWARPGIVERLGLEPDSSIARDVGVTRQRVSQVRERLGIRAYSPRDHLPKELIELLGHQPDSEIAEAFGVKVGLVRDVRKDLGIDRYSAPCGTPARYAAGCRCAGCKKAARDYNSADAVIARAKKREAKRATVEARVAQLTLGT